MAMEDLESKITKIKPYLIVFFEFTIIQKDILIQSQYSNTNRAEKTGGTSMGSEKLVKKNV